MSNVITFNTGGGGGGGTNIQTITGNNLVPIGPDGAQNINLFGQNGLTVTSVGAAANSLDIIPGQQFTVTTIDATVTNVGTIPLLPNQAVAATALVCSARDDFSASMWSNIVIGARRVAGGAILVEAVNPNAGDDAPIGNVVQVGADVVGNDLVFTVQGEAGTTWNWTLLVNFVYQS